VSTGLCQLPPRLRRRYSVVFIRMYQGRTAAIVPPKKRVITVPNAKAAVVKCIVSSIGLNYIVIMYHSDTKVCNRCY